MGKTARQRYNQVLTKHHIMPDSKLGNSSAENINRIARIVHQAIHTIFANETPVEQAEHLILNINSTALTDCFKDDVRDILDQPDEYIYKKGIFRNKYK